MMLHASLITNLVPSAYFCFKAKAKKLWGQGCLTAEKKSFTVLYKVEVENVKMVANGNFIYPTDFCQL